jgi:hypothetical protein
MEALTRQVMEMVQSYGGSLVGIATLETLAGGPPSADLRYKGAKSIGRRAKGKTVRPKVPGLNIKSRDRRKGMGYV